MSNMVINTNVLALNSHRALKGVGNDISKSSERLSSGMRINRAADDAAGLAISEKMRSQIRGLQQASTNAQDGISLIQTAEGALQETENMLQRMRQLTLQASNDTLEATDRNKIVLELNQLTEEIDANASKTEFNKKKLIDGSWEKQSIWLQTGANKAQGLSFNIGKIDATTLGVAKTNIGDKIEMPASSTVEIFSGTDAAKIFNGTASLSLDFDNPANAEKFMSAVGVYDFGSGKTMEITADKTIVLSGFGAADKTWTMDDIYALDGATDTLFADATGAGSLLYKNTAGVKELVFTAGTGGTLPAVDATGITALGASKTISFGGGNVLSAVVGKDGITYSFMGDAKVYDGGGNLVDTVANKAYTADEFSALFSDNTVVMNGVSVKMTDVNTAKSAAGEYAYTKSPTIGTSDGKEISKLTDTIDNAIEIVSQQRAKLGAYQNRLEHTIKNVDVSAENLSASESRIRDTDMAKEMMTLTQKNVLSQAAISMLAQANQGPQSLLQLLR